MKEYNFSINDDYHTQINNEYKPHSTCNVTSLIMALKQSRQFSNFDWPEKQQPEDYLYYLLNSDTIIDVMKKSYPQFLDSRNKPIVNPNEIHALLKYIINKLFGKIDSFYLTLTISEIINKLCNGSGVVLSGNFPYHGRTIGHMVSLAGFAINDKEDIIYFIIDDPYGNYKTNYTDRRGNNIKMPIDDFNKIFLRKGGIWGHIIKPNA